ncbi:MAG: M13 family metallopeptidase [Gammaproteobacteria bacterium]
MDPSIAPGDDFFAYANGSWLKTVEIPADKSRAGNSAALQDLTEARIRALVEQLARNQGSADVEGRKIGRYYETLMNEARIEALGMRPLRPKLARIAAISDRRGLARFLGGTLRADVDVINSTNLYTDNLFGLWVARDFDKPDRYAPFLLQGGLGLPDRNYYLDPSPQMEAIRGKYARHVAAVLRIAGVANAEARAAGVIDLERRIALAQWTRERSRDMTNGNNRWRIDTLETQAPGLSWKEFLAAARFPGAQQEIIAWQPTAIAGIAALVGSQPIATWKDYLILHTVDRSAAFLPKAVVDENFAFYGVTLNGTQELGERWKRAVQATNDALGEAVGKRYVALYFPGAAKRKVEAMVERIRGAFSDRLSGLDWMTPQTRANARAKLSSLKVGIGYPPKWRDFSGLEVVAGDALGNAERASLFTYQYNLKKLGRPVDRDEWVMTAQTVNAVNLPVMNAINIPAAVLQPPYFDAEGDDASNYGAIGTLIGHEVSHSFDDHGALFDATGRLRNWWTPTEFAYFEAAGARLARQFDGYRPFPDLAVNGTRTLSENIADVAGLAAALSAYRAASAGQDTRGSQAFTGEQRFFLSYAQSRRDKSREEAVRRQILTNGHAPPSYRVATVRNLDSWYRAFDVRPGQQLYLAPSDRVPIW